MACFLRERKTGPMFNFNWSKFTLKIGMFALGVIVVVDGFFLSEPLCILCATLCNNKNYHRVTQRSHRVTQSYFNLPLS